MIKHSFMITVLSNFCLKVRYFWFQTRSFFINETPKVLMLQVGGC